MWKNIKDLEDGIRKNNFGTQLLMIFFFDRKGVWSFTNVAVLISIHWNKKLYTNWNYIHFTFLFYTLI